MPETARGHELHEGLGRIGQPACHNLPGHDRLDPHGERLLPMTGNRLDDIPFRHHALQRAATTAYNNGANPARRQQIADLPDGCRRHDSLNARTFVFQDRSNSHVILPCRAVGAPVTPDDITCEPTAEARSKKHAPKIHVSQ